MHRSIVFIAVIALPWLVCGLLAGEERSEATAKVVEVATGARITVTIDETRETVRLSGILAPDLAKPHGEDAKQALSDKVLHKTVTLQFTSPQRDSTGSRPAIVLLDGESISAEMVRAGWAWPAPGVSSDALNEARAQAKAEKRGLWAEGDPTAHVRDRPKASPDPNVAVKLPKAAGRQLEEALLAAVLGIASKQAETIAQEHPGAVMTFSAKVLGGATYEMFINSKPCKIETDWHYLVVRGRQGLVCNPPGVGVKLHAVTDLPITENVIPAGKSIVRRRDGWYVMGNQGPGRK